MATHADSSVESVLSALVRRVDKKLQYTIHPTADAESVILTLRHGKLSRDVRIQLVTIRETHKDLAGRERLRMRIKQARDAMWGSVKRIPAQSTRMERAAPSEVGSFFRTGGGGGGPRR